MYIHHPIIMADIEALDTFNSTLKKLVRLATNKSKKLKLVRAPQRLATLLRECETTAMEIVGPALARHREFVMSSDEKHFLTSDLVADIPAEFSDDKKEIVIVINKLKKIYTTKCKPDEKTSILADLKLLLISYESYVKHTS